MSILAPIYKDISAFSNVEPTELVKNQEKTGEFLAEFQRKFDAHNVFAVNELKMMHENLIANSQIDGWALAEENAFLSKTFTFDNTAQANFFLNEVSKSCTLEDHHPEWNLKGNELQVRLTSHFNENKVSVKDYQLASEMNVVATSVGSVNPFARFSKIDGIEFLVGVFFLLCFRFVKFMNGKYKVVGSTLPAHTTPSGHPKEAIIQAVRDQEELKFVLGPDRF